MSVGSGGQRARSVGSSFVASKRFGEDSDAGTVENPATVERGDSADGVSSVPRSNNSGRKEDLELISATRPRRVVRVSGSLLSGPARRGLRTQTREDAEAHGEEPLTATRRTASSHGSPHYELLSPPRISPVYAKEVQAPAPARPLNFDTGSVALQRSPISPERRALSVKSENVPSQPAPSLPPPKMSVGETVTAAPTTKKRQFLMRVNGRGYSKIDCIGRGGSGKVYSVATASGTMLALKRVSLQHMDEATEKGLRVEIELLQRLRNVERVIQLIDYEMNREKQLLCVVSIIASIGISSEDETANMDNSSWKLASSTSIPFSRTGRVESKHPVSI